MIRTIRPLDRPDPGLERVGKANGFSLLAGVSCEGHQKEKERAHRARETALVPKPRVEIETCGRCRGAVRVIVEGVNDD